MPQAELTVTASFHSQEMKKRKGENLNSLIARIETSGFLTIAGISVIRGFHFLELHDPDGRNLGRAPITAKEADEFGRLRPAINRDILAA